MWGSSMSVSACASVSECECECDFARDRMCKCDGDNKIAKEKKACVEGFLTVMSTMNV